MHLKDVSKHGDRIISGIFNILYQTVQTLEIKKIKYLRRNKRSIRNFSYRYVEGGSDGEGGECQVETYLLCDDTYRCKKVRLSNKGKEVISPQSKS